MTPRKKAHRMKLRQRFPNQQRPILPKRFQGHTQTEEYIQSYSPLPEEKERRSAPWRLLPITRPTALARRVALPLLSCLHQ